MPRVLLLSLPLLLLYLGLTGNPEISNLVVGYLLSIATVVLLGSTNKKVEGTGIPASLAAMFLYLLILVLDLIKSGIQVAGIVLAPSLPIKPGIIAIQSGCKSELAKALSAHAITLTPGELVVEMGEDGTMYTHILDVTQAENYMIDAQNLREKLLKKIFR